MKGIIVGIAVKTQASVKAQVSIKDEEPPLRAEVPGEHESLAGSLV